MNKVVAFYAMLVLYETRKYYTFFYKQEIIAVRKDGFLDFVGSFLCSGAKYFFII
jgi:hypothetical protein